MRNNVKKHRENELNRLNDVLYLLQYMYLILGTKVFVGMLVIKA